MTTPELAPTPNQYFRWLDATEGEKLTPELCVSIDTFFENTLYKKSHQSLTLPTEGGMSVKCDYTLLQIPESQTYFLVSSNIDHNNGSLTYAVSFITHYRKDTMLVWEQTYREDGNALIAGKPLYALVNPFQENDYNRTLFHTSRLSDKNWRIPLLYNRYLQKELSFQKSSSRTSKNVEQERLERYARKLYTGLADSTSPNRNLYNRLYIGTIFENLTRAKPDFEGMGQLAQFTSGLEPISSESNYENNAKNIRWFVEPTMLPPQSQDFIPQQPQVVIEEAPPQHVGTNKAAAIQPDQSIVNKPPAVTSKTEILSAYRSGLFHREAFYLQFKNFYNFDGLKINHPLLKMLDRAYDLLLTPDCWSFSYKNSDNNTIQSRYIALTMPESNHLLLIAFQEEASENTVISKSCHFSWVRATDIGGQGWVGEIVFTHKNDQTNIEVKPELYHSKLASNPRMYMDELRSKKSWPQWFLIMSHFLDKRSWNDPPAKVVNLLEQDGALEDAFSKGIVDIRATASISRLANAQLLATEL